jgi:hypothetical protein
MKLNPLRGQFKWICGKEHKLICKACKKEFMSTTRKNFCGIDCPKISEKTRFHMLRRIKYIGK